MDEVSVEQEALTILFKLSEDQLRDEVVVPLFRHKGLRVEVIDENREVDHGCDLLLESHGQGERILVGVQLKVHENISTRSYVKKNIQRCARDGFGFRFGKDGRGRLATFRWITTGKISEIGATFLREELEEPDDLGGKVEVWDINTLYQELRDSVAMREIGALRIIDTRLRIEEHKRRREGVFAAHWCYRVFREYLLETPPDPGRALEYLAVGVNSLDQDRWREHYFFRVYRLVLSTWIDLLHGLPHLSDRPGRLEDILTNPEARNILDQKIDRPLLIDLLLDFEFMFRQLVQLEKRYADSPAGLSTLLICRLLLRFGFSPEERGISARLERIKDELRAEKGKSVDDECSLCSGVALSCFSLARMRKVVRKSEKWILGLGAVRYSHILPRSVDLPANEHALHYAAAALLGLLDLRGVRDKNLHSVVDVFFQSQVRDQRGFFSEWIRYSNVDRFEVYRFILSTFLRYFLMGGEMSPERRDQLREAVRVLVKAVQEESPESTKTFVFYPARTNLASFLLGMLLDVNEGIELAHAIGGLLHRRALTAGERRDGQLWDSSVDRTVIFIESLLEYWETIIYLTDAGHPIADLLPTVGVPHAAQEGL